MAITDADKEMARRKAAEAGYTREQADAALEGLDAAVMAWKLFKAMATATPEAAMALVQSLDATRLRGLVTGAVLVEVAGK